MSFSFLFFSFLFFSFLFFVKIFVKATQTRRQINYYSKTLRTYESKNTPGNSQ